MIKWFASLTFTIGGMILVPALLVAAGWSGLPLLVTVLPWLGLIVCLHLLVRGRPAVSSGSPASAEQSREPRRVEAILSDRVVFERTTTAILEDFVNCEPEDFEENIGRALSRLGSFIGANRCYLYRFRDQERESERLLTWLAPQDDAAIDPPALLPVGEAARLDRILEQEPVVLVNDLDGSDHPLVACSPWSGSGNQVRSCGVVRILQNGRNIGFLGFDAKAVSDWGAGEKSMLQLLANLLSTMSSRVDAQRCQLKAIESLKATSKAKTDFLANMSHEIRTPLNGVIGIADVLQDMGLTPRQLEYVDMIRESGSLLMNLVNDVLDLSKIEAGELILELVETDLRDLLDDVVGLTAFNAQARGLEMVCRVAPGVPEQVLVDSGRLRQILTNLLNNATKFTQEGHVYLNVEPVGDLGDALELRFEIIDTGIGISHEQVDRIFEKFTQADPSTTRRFGGTGLGLSICRHLVGLMGGKIWASGVLGEGATFSFTLPLKPLKLQVPIAPPDHVHRVLLITGHELGGTVLSEQIRHLGHRCEVAEWTVEARQLVSQAATGVGEPWSLVVLDPNTLAAAVDSILALVEKTPESRRPRVVLLSQLAGMSRERRPGDGRADLILTKPVRTGQLAALLAAELLPESGKGETDAVTADHTEREVIDRPRRALRVLLAEDNPFNQKVACGMLEQLGCRVAVAVNGRQALTMVQDEDFDMIFMDCQMPEMDGYEGARRIRELSGPVSRVPIVAITANAFSDDREACLAAGMDDFLTKPVNKNQLERILAKWESVIASGNRQPS